ncbi:MAG: DUF4430 domain-containing protein [Tepidanaerobacteraceae bacterium]|jgi:hypothetical protein|nr:DUF4430 domain-containing protein [Tepidanaerobacteraceae bacterium]
MKKTVYVMIFAAILLGIAGPLILSGMNCDADRKSVSSAKQPAIEMRGPESTGESRDKRDSMQASASDGSSQDSSRTHISREMSDSSAASGSEAISSAYSAESANSAISKDSQGKNNSQQPARNGSGQAQSQNKGEDKNGAAVLEESSAETPTASDGGAAGQQEGTQISLAIVGAGGKIIFGPAKVIIKDDDKWGATVLGALDASGVEYGISPRFAGFVTSIAGESNNGMKGWMYEVNDRVPMTAADKMKLAPGDRVLWWYSESLDKPAPAWDEIEKKQ